MATKIERYTLEGYWNGYTAACSRGYHYISGEGRVDEKRNIWMSRFTDPRRPRNALWLGYDEKRKVWVCEEESEVN